MEPLARDQVLSSRSGEDRFAARRREGRERGEREKREKKKEREKKQD